VDLEEHESRGAAIRLELLEVGVVLVVRDHQVEPDAFRGERPLDVDVEVGSERCF